ncbi:response regulator [Paenibacillus sp. NPDC056579]|uniref:response regulator transcription factor n=1 Tax=Paenibacillus sp. NPDC056579 TaxID=3345871 RepID=UPI0036852862
MNVLIVDDQRLSRAGIIGMIDWDRLGLKLAGECANGREALELIGDAEADIVITDVRMPVMNGLELIERAKELYTGVAFVVISGYDDYVYVRKSIQLTVADYLLKPVDAQELNELLERLIGQCAEAKRKEAEELQKRREQFFYFLLEGAYDNDSEHMAAEFSDIRFSDACDRYAVVVFESDLDKNSVYRHIDPLSNRYAVCIVRTRGVYMLVAAGAVLTAEELSSSLQSLMGGDSLFRLASVGKVVEGIGALRESIGQAFDTYSMQASLRLPEHPADKPVTYERYEPIAAPLTASWEQDWVFQLRQGNRSAALRKLAELLQANEGSSAHPDVQESSYQYVLLRGARELYEQGMISEPDYVEACRLAKTLPHIMGLDGKRAAVTDFFRRRLQAPEAVPSQETRHAVEKAKAYIDAHYCETINLSDLAQSSYMSPGYFSSLFRQYTGRNFLEYITHLRIEHAKSMIEADPEQKISDIAMQCGYQDLKYFRKLFKRHTGATPLKYKEDAVVAQKDRP